jgi:ADP-ribose pyrophosphatase YjhB (NUDIX family)
MNLWAMKREFPEVPLVGIGAIIIEDSRVLLVKRAHPPLQAQWSIPGGVLEVGELVREAATREAREETGLIVEPGELLGVYEASLRWQSNRKSQECDLGLSSPSPFHSVLQEWHRQAGRCTGIGTRRNALR